MAPTIIASMINSNHLLPLTNKLRKPIVEKMRRERINSSIEKLKSLLGGEFLKQQPDSRQEKADILEMTVYFLRQQQQSHKKSSCSTSADEGYSRCVQEAINFLPQCQVHTQSQRRLLSHFLTMQPSMEKSRSVVPQLSSPACQIISKGDSRLQWPLETLVEPHGHFTIRKPTYKCHIGINYSFLSVIEYFCPTFHG